MSEGDTLTDHEERIRALERGAGSIMVALEKHMTWAETIWQEQQRTTERLETLIGKIIQELNVTSRKLWMILGACSLAAGSTGIITWILSRGSP